MSNLLKVLINILQKSSKVLNSNVASELSKSCKAKAKETHIQFSIMKKKYEKDANEQMLALFEEDFIDQKNQLEDTLDNLLAQQATINEVDPSVLDEYNNRLKEVFS